MELYPLDDIVLVSNTHNYTVASYSRQFQRRGESIPFYYQGVISPSLKGVGQAFIYGSTIMINEGTLAMCRHRGTDNLTAIDIAYALVSQTDTENRDSPGKVADKVVGDTRFKGGARSWRDDNVRRVQALNLRQGYLVMAINYRFPAQFP
jgi:hypothetical protein